MVTAANQLQTPKDEAADIVTSDDGGSTEQLPVVELRPEHNKLDVGAEPLPKDGVVDHIAEKRAKIQANAKARRSQGSEFTGDGHDADALYGKDTNKDDLGPIEREAIARREEHNAEVFEQPEEVRQPKKPLNGLDPDLLSTQVRTIVDGEETTITVEEAIRNYQIGRAAEVRLDQANKLLSQAKSFHRNAAQPHVEEEENDQTNQGQQEESEHALDFRAMADKIRLGTDDEAADTLQELIALAQQDRSTVDPTDTVLAVLEDRNSEAQLRKYAKNNPDLLDPVMQSLVIQHTHRMMADDLVAAGIPAEELRGMVSSAQDLTDLHKRARINRAPVRDTGALLEAAHKAAKAWRSGGQQPAPATPAPAPALNRTARKEALTPQPAMRRQASLTTQQPTASIEQIRADAVAKIRKGRGQSA